MANNRPWMALWVKDYLADTLHLTTEESGAYMHLIMFYWVNGHLPCNEDAVARVTRLDSRAWAKSRATLKGFFGGGNSEEWVHKRIDREIAQAIEISNRRSASAKLMHSKRSASAQQMHTHSHSHSHKKAGNGIFQESKKAEASKQEWKWYARDSEQWKAWRDWWIKNKGINPPNQTSRHGEDGSYFQSEFPPTEH